MKRTKDQCAYHPGNESKRRQRTSTACLRLPRSQVLPLNETLSSICTKQHTVWASEGSRSPNRADSVSVCTVLEDIPVLRVRFQSSCFDLGGEVNVVTREGLSGGDWATIQLFVGEHIVGYTDRYRLVRDDVWTSGAWIQYHWCRNRSCPEKHGGIVRISARH